MVSTFVNRAWNPVAIGGGGWVVGFDIAPDGTKVGRQDVYGGYRWDDGRQRWVQIVTSRSMPKADVDIRQPTGCWALRIAPSRSSRFYMTWNGYVFRSDDKGASWTRTAFARSETDSNANGSNRLFKQSMAVDPRNPNVVIATTITKARMSTNAGATWVDLPLSGSEPTSGGHAVAFDPSSSVSGGRTQGIYVFKTGAGLFRSTNGGASWTLLSGGPTTFRCMAVSPTGTVLISQAANATGPTLSVYRNGAWSVSGTVIAASAGNRGIWSLAFHPTKAGLVVAAADNANYMAQSTDGGLTWGSTLVCADHAAVNIPWHHYANEGYLSCGDLAFDPTDADMLYLSSGIGVWRWKWTGTTGFTINEHSVGLDNMVSNCVIAPQGGKAVFGLWDRAYFAFDNVNVFPSTHGVNNVYPIVHGWALDYASSQPGFVVGCANNDNAASFQEQTGFSTDGGATWSVFPAKPAGISTANIGGCIAAATPDNIVWIPAQSPGYVTRNRGTSWTALSLPGVTSADYGGLINTRYNKRFIVAADRVTTGTFYVYHSPKGLFRSTDGGSTWTLVFSGEVAGGSYFNAKLRAAPGNAGHLFFCSGTIGNEKLGTPSNFKTFRRSTNGGQTWTDVPVITGVADFGFGRPAPGATYPSIVAIGFVNGVFGIYRSDDAGASWNYLGQFPGGTLDEAYALSGDMDVFGRAYIGYQGSSFLYYDTPTDGSLVMIAAPTISGTAATGQQLTSTAGTYSAPGATPAISRQWMTADGTSREGVFVKDDLSNPLIANPVPIAGATGSSFTLRAQDVAPNKLVYCEVTATSGSDVLKVATPAIGNPYVADPLTTALLARLSVQPGDGRRSVIDTFIAKLRSNGLLAKIDAFYIPGALYTPGNTDFLKSPSGSGVDLVMRAGTASANANGLVLTGGAYAGTNFNPAAASGATYTQNSAHMFIFMEGFAAAAAGGVMGCEGASIGRTAATSGNLATQGNTVTRNTSGTAANNDTMSWVRRLAGQYQAYSFGANPQGTYAQASILPNAEFEIGRAGPGSGQVGFTTSFVSFGGSLTDAEQNLLRSLVFDLRDGVATTIY